jgi:vitamin B12 transporter
MHFWFCCPASFIKNNFMKSVLLLLCILVTTNLVAQIIELNPITVTAARTPQKASETGRNITVMDGKLFNQLSVHSIDELLKYIPGVEVQSRGPMGAQSDIVLRGGTFQQVLVLLDGIKVNDPITGHFSSYVPVAPYEIERIEVLRGPAAAVYGAEAVGGVINIITKTFNKLVKEKSNHENIGVALGQYGFVNGSAGWHGTGQKLNGSLGVISNNTSGQLLRGTSRGYIHNHTFSGSVAMALKNNWQLALRSSYDTRDFAAQNFYTTFKSDTATEKVNTWWNQAQLKQQAKKHSQQLDILYKNTSDHYVYNASSAANDNRSHLLLLQYVYAQKISEHFNLNTGMQLDKRSIISNDRGDHSTAHGAVFATGVYSKNKVKISPGLRLDKDGNYGTALLPQLSASWQLQNVTLRSNIGKSIRGGDFTERYNNYNKAFVSGGSIGNPNLTTENAWSYEAGADLILSNHFKASATGFYRDQHNVIDFVTTPYADMPRKENLSPTGTYALAKNIKKVKTSGVEIELMYQKECALQQLLYINAGITFLHSVSTDPVPSFYIISHAKTLMQSTVLYQYKKASLSVNMVYKNRGALNAPAINAAISSNYFLLNSKLSYTLFRKLQLFVASNNITNIKYSDLLGSIMPARWTTAGVNIDL